MEYYGYASKDYLMHYGVMGMKWGVRKAKYDSSVSRGRNARDAAKALNRNARLKAVREEKADRYSRKISKLKTRQKTAKRTAKIKNTEQKLKEVKKQIDYGNTVSNKMIKDFKKHNYSVDSKKVQYYVGTGKQIAVDVAAVYGFGIPGAIAVNTARYNADRLGMSTNGNYYKVKDKRR